MTVQSFEIVLARDSGIYYPGEVIRGVLRLVTTADIVTRGVRIRYRGEGSMHYHVGSGDNRKDYDGNKIYEEHRFTVFGNYYNTSILDEAGEDAIFGSASGDGIMYIPCTENEPLKFIVRVMDYDFGKKDDLLGEVVVDVRELVASDSAMSYPLKRNGKPEKGEVTLSARIVPYNVVFPASGAGGKATAVCELRAHKATGLRKADFIGKNDVYVQAYRVGPEGADQSKALPGPNMKAVLPAGTVEFPYAFPIRPDAPGTAELRAGDWARVRYTLYANIDKAWWRDPSVKRAITVIAAYPKPAAHLLHPIEYRDATPVRISSCCCFPCLSGLGTVTVQAALGRQVFASGEPLELTASVQNATSSPLVVAVVLQCTISLRTTSRIFQHGRHFTRTIPISEVSVDAGDIWRVDGASRELKVPPTFPTFFGAKGLAPASDRDPVTFTYSVGLSVHPPGSCGSTHTVTIPVTISAVPPTAEALAAAKGEDRAPLQQAIPNAVPVFPSYTHDLVNYTAQDSHTLTGSLVAVDEPVSTHVPQEDKSAVAGLEQQSYQPHVLSYASNVPAAVAVVEEKRSVATSIDALVKTLQQGQDARSAVVSWAATHPSVSASLTPEQVTTIMSNVPLSLDHVCVSLELARFLGRELLKCAHISAACAVSTFFKAEVAAAMAPYAGDPGHKEAVLALVPGYDREKVGACFVEG